MLVHTLRELVGDETVRGLLICRERSDIDQETVERGCASLVVGPPVTLGRPCVELMRRLAKAAVGNARRLRVDDCIQITEGGPSFLAAPATREEHSYAAGGLLRPLLQSLDRLNKWPQLMPERCDRTLCGLIEGERFQQLRLFFRTAVYLEAKPQSFLHRQLELPRSGDDLDRAVLANPADLHQALRRRAQCLAARSESRGLDRGEAD